MRLVQLRNQDERRIALVEEPHLRMIEGFDSIYSLARASIERGVSLAAIVRDNLHDHRFDYDLVYAGQSAWRLLPPIDHPDDPSRTLVSGTGLTHLGSAKDRQAMHAVTENETDSMKMFRWGVEGGRPESGKVGTAPEWFYKGNGTILRAAGDILEVPNHAEDGGEEAEIAGVYLIGPDARPYRVGMAAGNEFSDHRFEKRNYLNLAGSKLRNCSIGPEIVIDAAFDSVPGVVTIERGGEVFWSKPIRSGQDEMCHSLANIEHHHFKFAAHRRPGDLHVHYYGAHSLSFGDGVELADGDVMSIQFENFGRALRNPLKIDRTHSAPVSVVAMK